MNGFDVSSSERYSGRLLLEATPVQGPEGAVELVERRLRSFIEAIGAGFFFPGRLHPSAPQALRVSGASAHGRVDVDDLPVTALDVLAGMLADCGQHGIRFHAARAVLGPRELNLLRDYGSHLAMRGVPLKVIQELMGHATIEMTMRYAHLAPEARESAVQQLDRPVPQLHAAPGRDAGGAH
jgi:integrase